MAPAVRINKPDVLAVLPRPLGQSKGQYYAGEVYSQQPGSKKRKRLEVVVGVDGEAANIYHVPSSDLRTSYPIPPQESFTCPPYSIRYQRPSTSGRQQLTYLSTKEPSGFKITVCQDLVNAAGKTTSTSKSRKLKHKSPVFRLFTSGNTVSDATPASEANTECNDVLAVCQDGQVLCLDGSGLEERWSLSSYALSKDLLPPSTSGFKVNYAFHAPAMEFLNGIFEGRQDAFSPFGQPVSEATFNPDVLALVVSVAGASTGARFVVLLGAISGSSAGRGSRQPLVQLHVAPLPPLDVVGEGIVPTYQLSTRSGKLSELAGGTLRTYDLRCAVPRLRDAAILPDASSFVTLSDNSVLTISPSSLTVANITYRSIQAQAPSITDSSATESSGSKDRADPVLLTYLSKLDLAIALVDNTLFSIQVERRGQSSKEGLLIDAIGQGLSKADDLPGDPEPGKGPFKYFLPGTLTDSYVKKSMAEVERLDACLSENNLKEFERILASKFGIVIENAEDLTNGAAKENEIDTTPDWRWPERPKPFPPVDRRWVLYSISRVFSITVGTSTDDASVDHPTLDCVLHESNVLIYLVLAGHLTLRNIAAAFKHELSDTQVSKETLANEVIKQLIEVDPTLELLLNHLAGTKLGEIELLLIVRTIMQSMEHQPRLALPSMPNGTQEEDYVAMEIDKLEQELELAEYNLGDESDIRARLLTGAFERLAGYSAAATVRGLRASFSPTEILSLIHLLRIQLVGSAWTTRYSEPTSLDQDDGTRAPPDGAITLIAELLARCVDALGTNGWLSTGSTGEWDSGHFLTALKLEVNAALEGLNDAVGLNGILGEAVRFGTASLAGAAGRSLARAADRPRTLEVGAPASLPLGLTPSKAVTQFKVVSGGEVVERSARERGHLMSQKVKEYSLEKVTI